MADPNPDLDTRLYRWDVTSYFSVALLALSVPMMLVCTCGFPFNLVGIALWLTAPKSRLHRHLLVSHVIVIALHAFVVAVALWLAAPPR